MSNFKHTMSTDNIGTIRIDRQVVGWTRRIGERWNGSVTYRGTSARVEGWASASNAFFAAVRLHSDMEWAKAYPLNPFFGTKKGCGDAYMERNFLNADVTMRVDERNRALASSSNTSRYRVGVSRRRS